MSLFGLQMKIQDILYIEEYKFLFHIVFVLSEGIKPAPRIWLKWNMEKLEPPNIKMREEILNATKKKCMLFI